MGNHLNGRGDHDHRKGDGGIITEYHTLVIYVTDDEALAGGIYPELSGWLKPMNCCPVQTPCTALAVDLVFEHRSNARIAGPLGVTCCN